MKKSTFLLVSMLGLLFVFSGCKKKKEYKTAAIKLLYFKGKNISCYGNIYNKFNSKIINNNIYQNNKFKISINKCKIIK